MRFIKSFAGGVALLAIASGCASTTETGCGGAKPAAMPKSVAAIKAAPQVAVAAPAPKPASVGSRFDKPGFHTMVKDGRLWVFAEGSKELEAFTASGKTPAVHSTRIKAGPLGMTIIAPDLAVLDAYMNE